MCFPVGSIENRFFMLKPVNWPAGLEFYGRIPVADYRRRRVGQLLGWVSQVGRVSRVPGLLGHP